MYNKNLTEDLRLRLSTTDMEFLRKLSDDRASSVSECIRSIISEYRRSLDAINALKEAVNVISKKEAELSHGDTKTDINNQL